MTEKEIILKKCQEASANTLTETLGIEFVDLGEDFLTARMLVNSVVHQPQGVLHGGASAALAETVGSYASFIFLRDKDAIVRGVDITANHVKAVTGGYVYATAKKVHFGKTLQIWEIRITNEANELVTYAKHTTIALAKK